MSKLSPSQGNGMYSDDYTVRHRMSPAAFALMGGDFLTRPEGQAAAMRVLGINGEGKLEGGLEMRP